jgi:hypothetical protein
VHVLPQIQRLRAIGKPRLARSTIRLLEKKEGEMSFSKVLAMTTSHAATEVGIGKYANGMRQQHRNILIRSFDGLELHGVEIVKF